MEIPISVMMCQMQTAADLVFPCVSIAPGPGGGQEKLSARDNLISKQVTHGMIGGGEGENDEAHYKDHTVLKYPLDIIKDRGLLSAWDQIFLSYLPPRDQPI